MENINFSEIEKKWQNNWEKEKVFQADVNSRKTKFFINFPYPYINAYLHLGHGFSATRVDVIARFKRMQGYNVLFPQAWHCTGSPVFAAAQRIREKEKRQIDILKMMGFSDKEIPKFGEVKHWIDVFVPAAKEDFSRLGASVDWRRTFITTSLNPSYDKFIKWQFRKLKEKGYIEKGKHPVVWCPKDNMPVGDHDRVEGEGITTQEFSLLKFKFGDCYLIAATLRPETIFGETNFWVNPDVNYVKAKVNDEVWIISKECSEKLKSQDRELKIIGSISGKELVGKYCIAPLINKEIIILPAKFVNPSKGSGLVTSVPSDAPYDYIALRDLQENEEEIEKYNLNSHEIKKINPIPIIDLDKWGDLPAVKIIEQMKIKNQDDPNLEEATQVIYRAGFYSGKMNKNCGKYSGFSVEDAKPKLKQELLKTGLLDKFYELEGKVVCRCLTQCIPKIVSDQWFLKYNDKSWKKLAHKALDKMKLYPDLIKSQFNYVLDWLEEWACTHHFGTGTHLPWDEKWVIESLSDSTIYMAYYTIAHLIAQYPIEKINDEFFDFVFLGKGKGDQKMGEMRKEFEYWYPFDIRSTGKDLVQNHMSFCLFNHVAIFPQKYWPKGFSVNGWLLIQGEKMSKSKGNFYTIRQVLDDYPADVIRTALMLGGEGMDDPNFDLNNIKVIKEKLIKWYDFSIVNYNKNAKNEKTHGDDLFLSRINKYLKQGTESMENMLFRSGFDKLFFQIQKTLKEYISNGKTNPKLINEFIETQIKLLSPFCPHLAEELWEKIGNKSFVSLEKWPVADESKIDEELEKQEREFEKLAEDINHIIKLMKEKQNKDAKKAFIYVLPKEKRNYEINLEPIAKKTNIEINIFAVNDKNKYDPENRAGKTKPGKPAIYME